MTKLSPPRVLGLLFLFLLTAQITTAQDVIHCWDFNGTTPFTTPLNTDNRVSGSGSITHNLVSTTSFDGSTINTCSGSEAGTSFAVSGGAGTSSGGGNNGKHLDFNFSSEGYKNLSLSFWSRRSPAGFSSNTIEYSTDGTTFTSFPTGSPFDPALSPGGLLSFNLSSVTSIDNQSNLVIRIVFNGATDANGNNRIDNVKLEGEFLNDQTSEVVAPSTQVGASIFVAADTDILPVFSFDIIDQGGGDNEPTTVTQMRFVAGANNTADWSTFTNVAIQDASFTEIPGTAVVTASEVIFTPTTPVAVADGASVNFTVEVTLDQANIVDGSVIQFQVDGTNSGFEAEFSGSIFSSSFTDVVGNNITLDVVATEIAFLKQPTDVEVNAFMTPSVELGFFDVNGNLDTTTSSVVELTSTGDLDTSPLTLSPTNGIVTFSNIIHNTEGLDIILTASTIDPFSITSSLFDVFANDNTTEVIAPVTQVPVGTVIAANATASGTPESVFSFDIIDQGDGDNEPTTVTQMRFEAGGNNTANWPLTFQDVVVREASSVVTGTAVINDNEIIFTPITSVVVADGASVNFTVEVVLNETNITDESIIEFQVPETGLGFIAEISGSIFNSTFTGGTVTGNLITIDVVASEMAFLQQPTDVQVNAFITPAVQVAYVDENGNVDTSIITDISLTSSGGTLVNPLNPVSAVNGVATFPNIAYSAEVSGLTLTADTTEPEITPSSITSNPFNVGIPVIAIQDFDGTQPEWVYTTSIPTFDNGWGVDGYFGVINITDTSRLENPSFINTIFGENDLDDEGDNGTSGFASLDFVTVDVSGYTGVNLSFDWEVVGYNVPGDRIEYQVTFDGMSQTRVTLFEGFTSTQDGSGTETIPVPLGTNEVSFQYFIQNDGVDGFSGLDNVKLTGDSNARDTDILAPSTQIADATLTADVNDELAQAVEVFGFEVVDSGNFDNLPTNITRLRFVPGSTNNADWATALQGISISDGTDILDQANQTVTITTDEIIVDITSDPDDLFVVSDGTSRDYILSVFLNTTGIIDQEVIQLAIADGNEDQLASNDGSIFSQGITAFEGSEFLIEVIGTQLEFFVQPTTTFVNVSMSPSVRVRNLDANDNVDLDNTVSIVISSEGTLNGGLVSRNISSSLGYANFNTLQHTATGFDLRLTASTTSGSTSIQSLEFNIILESTLLISEVIDPSDDADGRYVELFNMDVEPIDLDDLNYFLINPSGTGESIQLTGVIPPKSYYVISFIDDATFNSIYGRDADFVAPTTLASDGTDIYQLSFDFNEPRAVLDVYGDAGTGWEFIGQRAYRNIPTVRVSNSTYTSSEWILEVSASSADATIGVGDNDYVYSNDTDTWGSVGIGTPTGGLISESIFVESGTTTLTSLNTISDIVVRDDATLIIEDAVTLNGDFANFGKVIFSSTSTKTAALGPFPATTRQLVGDNFEIHRFIPKSNRAFRYLSSSVTTTTSINANWQEGENNTSTGDTNNLDPNPGFGTHITGSTTGQNGFDATETGNPSMFEWNSSDVEWKAIPNTDSKTFNAGDAYALLIRGDRSTTLNSNTAVGPATTLRTTGKLVVGSKPAPNLSSTVNGFSLIGNPYQAKVDMASLLNSDNANAVSSQFFYIYDPTIGTIGSYATVDLSDGTSTPDSGANLFLEPNQAFFVETVSAAGSPIVIFRESYKTTETGNNTTFSEPEALTNMNINLNEDILTSGNTVIDAVRVKFRNGGNNAKDTLDATKLWNYEESFAIDRNPNYMSIESRAMPTAQDSVPLYFGNSKLLAYRLVVEPENLVNTKAYLYDRYLESSTELPTDIATSVSFNLDPSIPESKATDRFVIKFEEVSLGTEDVVFNSSMVVYPNPVRGNTFSISHQQAFDGQVLSLKLFDLQGRMVLDQELTNSSRMTVNLNNSLSSGVYILKLSDTKNSQTTKLIIE
ncbi:secreted outer membrane protein [Psychroflexus gondwanensis ACAM 44]|uniref:Secreted outer membrane protein n=1 Tax=Psychroflexus gondwanensis ACAM 44 TaxID=1189619 RepID=N1WVS6_9FLAO|nr:T9SS type A sorting domain-containing protein [Psychroflexus gondwanensis]EMY79938.1 secreted outer membrane protein [Psychroflexus gondwanensis ACAM 44]